MIIFLLSHRRRYTRVFIVVTGSVILMSKLIFMFCEVPLLTPPQLLLETKLNTNFSREVHDICLFPTETRPQTSEKSTCETENTETFHVK